jgi:TonB family protein
MRRSTDPRGSTLIAFLVGAAVLLHALIAGGAQLVQRYGFGLADAWDRSREDPVELDLDKDREIELLQGEQVVEIERPEKERVPRKARFRSEFDSRVEKETQSKNKGLRSKALATLDRPPSPRELQPRPTEAGRQGEPEAGVELKPDKQQPDKQQADKLRSDEKPSPLTMRRPTPRDRPKGPTDSKRRSKNGKAWKKKLSLDNLTPSNGTLQKVIPTAFPDYLKDIEYGDKTLLNTKQWKYASFFNRVKRAVAQHWHPEREYNRRDPKGNVYGFKNRLTILHVLLKPDGSLKRLVLERPCGLRFLDEEAMRAFRKAAPFPNPPRSLVNRKTRQIAFRFGFIFELSRSPSWKIFRLK